jgi:hypothetical protein
MARGWTLVVIGKDRLARGLDFRRALLMPHERLQKPVCLAGGFGLLYKLHDEIVKLVHEAQL